MNTSELEKKIAEYTIKMNKKVPIIKGGKLKLVGIQEHLRRFYKDEIAKLEKEKIALQNQKKYHSVIGWEKVKFENSQIRLTINNHLSEPYLLANSRSSFEFLRHYILKFNLKPLEVSILGNRITSINNLGELNSLIQILSIQDEINNYFENFESTSIDKILSKLKLISNASLFDFFKIKQKSLYLSFLCDNQYPEYRVIPTTEILLSNEKIISEEDTFLFTFKNINFIYIIWESTMINKATYIFRATESSYAEEVQKLFDFIASNQNRKRRKLRYSIKTKENPFNTVAVVEHDSIDTWTKKVRFFLLT